MPDRVLLERLMRGHPGAMDGIRERYSLTLYAIAYGISLDPRRSAAVVDGALQEFCRAAGHRELGDGPLYEQLAAITRRLAQVGRGWGA